MIFCSLKINFGSLLVGTLSWLLLCIKWFYTWLEKSVHFIDNSESICCWHFMKNIGVIDYVKWFRLQPTQILGICGIKLHIGNIANFVPHSCKSDVWRCHVDSNDLSIRENFCVCVGGKTRTCSDVKDSFGCFVSVKCPNFIEILSKCFTYTVGIIKMQQCENTLH